MMTPFIAVAPMMGCTDRHDRYFLRLMAPHVYLYTEMITARALVYGKKYFLLDFHKAEKPLALQLGGHEPILLAQCAKLAEEYGYDEVNLNVGCPSDRVKSGQFGACLMLESPLVADCVAAMSAHTSLPVTVKCRVGVDHQDSYDYLAQFIQKVSSAGCKMFIIHARKAWLDGLSPKQNREIPPLQYDMVYQIKKDFPALKIILNGGIQAVADIDTQLPLVDGVMIGRAAYANPYLLAEIEQKYFTSREKTVKRSEIINKFIPYIREQLMQRTPLSAMTRHILGLFRGQHRAAIWRRYLSEHSHRDSAGLPIVKQALALMLKK